MRDGGPAGRGLPRVEDEDEFAEHRVLYGCPESLVSKARQTCEWLMEAGCRDGDGAEPFASAYRHWLDLVR
ncbi:hypothetical protein ABZ252_15905 [Streptomyces sp. NPDC006175]|uniref:hypothetical protein n=1 Tax=unclassified Streptomyces TaxID=2593676 RepID=UPI0033B96BE5